MLRHPIDYLEILWQKPEATRKKILVVSVSLLSSIVIIAWLMTFSVPSISELAASETEEPVRVGSVWESLRGLVSNLVSETVSENVLENIAASTSVSDETTFTQNQSSSTMETIATVNASSSKEKTKTHEAKQ